MASILDILRGASEGAKSPTIPSMGGFSKGDVNNAAKMAARLKTIDKLLNSSSKHWAKLGEARSLQQANTSMRKFASAQRGFNAAMKTGNVSMHQRVKAYDKLATARKKAMNDVKEHNIQLNEQRGILGRTQNVLNEVAEHKGMAIFTAAIRDASIVLGDMNQGFDVMARSGQIQNKTMGELAKSTGYYMTQLKMGSIQAAQFGITAEDSNAAFAQLTETYGGTSEVVEDLGNKWSGMAAIAKLSGLGMADVASLANQNFLKLGETLDETMNTVVAMSDITAELNQRFGEGSVNTKAFASAIQQLAYGASFMNQNSRMLTETLGRELQMQLALGRAPEAALKNAQKNIELAGKVNIVGVLSFRDDMQDAYDSLTTQAAKDAHLKNLVDEFGSEGEIIANMLSEGRLQSADSLFAFQQAVQNSAKLRSDMLGTMRDSAAAGDIGALLSVGLGINEAQYMIEEAKLLTAKLGKLKGAGGEAQAEALFGANWQSDPDAKRLFESVRAGGKSDVELHREFRKMGGPGKDLADKALAEAGKPEDTWRQWVDSNIEAGWFGGITNSFATITGLLATLPLSLGAVIGALMMRKGLGRMLGNVGMPGMGAKGGSMLGRGAGMLGRGAGMLGRGAMMGMRGIAGLASKAGPIAAAIASIGGFAYGIYNAAEILGKVDVTGAERAAAGLGQAASILTFGLLDAKRVAESSLMGGAFLKSLFTGDDPLAATAGDKGDGTRDAYESMKAAGKPMAQGTYEEFMSQRAQNIARPKPRKPVVEDTPVSAAPAAGGRGGGVAAAIGTLDGGSLILEVQNWGSVFAQTVNEAAGSGG